jgi:hypothetical protein
MYLFTSHNLSSDKFVLRICITSSSFTPNDERNANGGWQLAPTWGQPTNIVTAYLSCHVASSMFRFYTPTTGTPGMVL